MFDYPKSRHVDSIWPHQLFDWKHGRVMEESYKSMAMDLMVKLLIFTQTTLDRTISTFRKNSSFVPKTHSILYWLPCLTA